MRGPVRLVSRRVAEGFQLYLAAPDALSVRRLGARERIEVRGAPDYERAHDPADPLHAFLDRLDPHTVSTLFAGDEMTLNPRNPRHAPSFAACATLFAETP